MHDFVEEGYNNFAMNITISIKKNSQFIKVISFEW